MKIKTKSIAVLAVGILAFSAAVLPAKALTVEELQAQIQALLAQIAALQAQIDGQALSSTAFKILNPANGSAYSSGEQVKVVWTSPGPQGPYSLELFSNGSRVLVENELKAGCSASAGNCTYLWTVPQRTWASPEKSTEQIAITDGNGRKAYSEYFNITNSRSKFTLLTPNGGERWMLNSNQAIITWNPNPHSDSVVAYLEKLKNGRFVTLGRMIAIAKGSIVWGGELDRPGNYAPVGSDYYVRILDRATGATDRSDRPFTILPSDYFKVDLKINGSDGPVRVPAAGAYVDISWSATNVGGVRCTFMPGDLGQSIYGLDSKGSKRVFLKGNPYEYDYAVHMSCSSSVGDRSDYVEIPHASFVKDKKPSMRVVSPNGGERWVVGNTYTFKWSTSNQPTNGVVGIALVDQNGRNHYLGTHDCGYGTDCLPVSVSSYSWKVDLPPGKYKARIFCGIKASEAYCPHDGVSIQDTVEDSSDGYFYITEYVTPPNPAPVPPPTTNREPVGYHDVLSCELVQGWSCDPDSTSSPVNVVFYKDRAIGQGGTFVGSVTANLLREPAVGAICGGNSAHGFSYATPYQLKDGQRHSLYAYAVDRETGGAKLLSASPKTVSCAISVSATND